MPGAVASVSHAIGRITGVTRGGLGGRPILRRALWPPDDRRRLPVVVGYERLSRLYMKVRVRAQPPRQLLPNRGQQRRPVNHAVSQGNFRDEVPGPGLDKLPLDDLVESAERGVEVRRRKPPPVRGYDIFILP